MKEIKAEIVDILWSIPNMTKNIALAMIVPLKTEQQATTFLNYLKENKNNQELMRIDNLLKIRREIAKQN